MIGAVFGVTVYRFMLSGPNSYADILRMVPIPERGLLLENNNEFNRQVSSNKTL